MADYYTKHSTIMKLPDKAAQQYAVELARKARAAYLHIDAELAHALPTDFPEQLIEDIHDWDFEVEAEGESDIWIHSEDGGIDAACAFMQHLLQRFDPTGAVAFEWSYDCSKPRTEAYGGGAAFITATAIKTMNTGQWLDEHISAWEEKEA